MADMDEVSALLHIHEKASAHGELLKNIADLAMAKLKAINEEHGLSIKAVELEPGISRPALELSEPEPKPTMRRV